MSNEQISRVWRSSLPSHLRLVAVAIADSANDDGVCWPGQMKLADKCGLGDRQLRNSLAALEEQGYLTSTQRGKRRTNVYELHLDREGNPTGVTGTTVPGDRNHSSASDRNHSSGPNRNPQIEPSENPKTMAPAALEPDPPWVEPTRTFPDGKRSTTDDGERARQSGWAPMNTIHQWKHPTHGFRDLLWEATTAAFGEPATNRERQRRSKAVALFREAECDPAEIGTLKRVYELKMSHAANTDLAVAGHITNCRRWANEVTTIDPDASRRTVKAELQERARLHLLEAGPGPEKEWMRQR